MSTDADEDRASEVTNIHQFGRSGRQVMRVKFASFPAKLPISAYSFTCSIATGDKTRFTTVVRVRARVRRFAEIHHPRIHDASIHDSIVAAWQNSNNEQDFS
jgi:hypothetical protein